MRCGQSFEGQEEVSETPAEPRGAQVGRSMEPSREELLLELDRRERQIRELTAELAQYRSFFHGRKIAVSAEIGGEEDGAGAVAHSKDRR